jgi:hypothetical protein
VTFAFPISFKDHYRAARTIQRHQLSYWFAWLFFLGVPLILMAFMLWQGYTIGNALREQGGALMGGPAFMFIAVPLLRAWGIRSARRSNPSIVGEHVFEFTADGLEMRGGLHSVSLKWEAFTRAVETRDFFLLYFAANTAYFLPKHVVTSRVDIDRLRDLLRRSMPGRVKLRSASVRASLVPLP